LIDPGGSVSNIGLPDWAGKRAGLRYPARVRPEGYPTVAGGSRTWVRQWDEAVARARSADHLNALVDSEDGVKVLRLPMRPLEALAFWVYAGSSLFGGFLYCGAGLIALWASPRGALSRAFAMFAAASGLVLFGLFDIHTERTLAPVFFLALGFLPASVVTLLLNLPEPAGWARRAPWATNALLLSGLVVGAGVVGAHFADVDTRPLQTLISLLSGLSLVLFVVGFSYRFALSRAEQKNTLRPLLVSMVPAYTGLGACLVLWSWGVLPGFPDFLFLPALVFAPLASLYAFVRHDLWGSRALLSRVGTNLIVAVLACAVAIAAGTALAASMGARFGDALAGAAGGGVTAALLVVAALRLSDIALFRSRVAFKPTIDRLSEDLTALSSPGEVAQAVERTVRRWLPCDFILFTLTSSSARGVPVREPPPTDAEANGDISPGTGSSARKVPEPLRPEQSDLRIPATFGGQPFGWLDVGAKRGGALFTSDDIDLLRAIANHGGLALAHAWAYQELEQRRRQQADAWRGEREALVETVAAEMAHEIRYPINYFRTLFESKARNVPLTEDDIDVGREEVDRLERLVSGLKRMAAHRIERVPTTLTEVCAKVEALLRDSLGKRRIELEVPRETILRCDPDKMTQVITNLLANALEASGPNGRLGITWSALSHGGELVIWDDGPGFVGDPARLFAPWYTTKPRGTGLGLAITHRLVRSHGWNITAQRVDARTTFSVTVRAEDIVHVAEASELSEKTARVA
jgi:signal transduction histidine kinase